MKPINERIEELEQYRPELTKREDFAAFWETTLNHGKRVPLASERLEADYPFPYAKVYEISYCGFDETRIYGWLLLPVFVKKEKYPCVIHYHGFTDSRGYPWQFMQWLMMGMAVLSVDCREQGGITGNCAACRGSGQVGNVVTRGILDKNEYYYRAVYVDCIKAIDFAASCPEIDKDRIVVRGTSQGGALAMAVCALDHRPALALANVPGNSNIEQRVIGGYGSFSAVHDYLKKYPDHISRVFETLSYFDTMNMADQIQCPVFASVALEDEICPAKCYYASYNRIKVKKTITVYPFNGHDGAGEYHMERELQAVSSLSQ